MLAVAPLLVRAILSLSLSLTSPRACRFPCSFFVFAVRGRSWRGVWVHGVVMAWHVDDDGWRVAVGAQAGASPKVLGPPRAGEGGHEDLPQVLRAALGLGEDAERETRNYCCLVVLSRGERAWKY